MLQDMLQASWFQKESFTRLKEATEGLMVSLNRYTTFLQEKLKYQNLHHKMSQPSVSRDDSTHTLYLPQRFRPTPTNLLPLQETLLSRGVYDPVCLVDFTPADRRQRYKYCLYVYAYTRTYLLACTCTHYHMHMHTLPHTHTHTHHTCTVSHQHST